MSRIRKLYLQNAAGERYGLNGENGVYASSLAGFGTTLTPSFADLGNGFFIQVSDEAEPQGAIPFTITFTKNPYQTYQGLVNWLFSAEKISVVYDPYGNQEYYRDVTINFLQKGEKNQVGWLEVPCSYMANTPWYLPSPTSLSLDSAGGGDSKRYTYKYSDTLRYGNDSTAALSGTIAGAGHVPGALELTYYGAITNPQIRLTGNITGKTYGICSITVNLIPSDTLKVSTRREDSYVKKIAANGQETDLLDALELSTTPFFRIPVSEPCTISIEADAAFDGRADLLVYYYYRSV